jgi:hypothetical protein
MKCVRCGKTVSWAGWFTPLFPIQEKYCPECWEIVSERYFKTDADGHYDITVDGAFGNIITDEE